MTDDLLDVVEQEKKEVYIPPAPVKASDKLPAATTEQQMINSIAQIAADPNTDIEKVERLLDVQIKMMDRQAKMDYDQALSRVQSDMPRIALKGEIKNKNGAVTSRYMKYEDIDREVRPILKGEGFSLVHNRHDENNKMIVTTTLKHRNGHEESVSIPLPYDQPNALKNAVQAAVSTFSYGKRVNVCSLLNIVAEGEDDDGQNSEANPITDAQSAEIKRRCQAIFEYDQNITGNLLAYLRANTVETIPASKYELALDVLKRKEKSVEKAQEEVK